MSLSSTEHDGLSRRPFPELSVMVGSSDDEEAECCDRECDRRGSSDRKHNDDARTSSCFFEPSCNVRSAIKRRLRMEHKPRKEIVLPRCDVRSVDVRAVYPLLPISGSWADHREIVRKRERHACTADMHAYAMIQGTFPEVTPMRPIRATFCESATVYIEKCIVRCIARGEGDGRRAACL